MQNKRIWIINHYATDAFFDKGGRHYYLSKYLKEAGYEVTVFCANTFHDSRESLELNGKEYITKKADSGVEFVFLKTSGYTGNGKARVMNMINFYRSMMKCSKNFERPDIIVGSSVHPLACIAAIKLSKKFKCKNIIEIRDLWPLSIVVFMDEWTDKNPLIRLLYKGERWIYQKADALIFTMEGGAQYIKDKGWDDKINLDKVFNINNGVDIESFRNNIESAEGMNISKNDRFRLVYTGSIRPANDVLVLAEILKKVNEKGYQDRIEMFLYGGGTKEYIEQIEMLEIPNLHYMGKVEKNKIPYILRTSDLNLLHYREGGVLKYGGSQNKLFEYLASGKPIFSTIKPSYDLIERYDCGFSTNSRDLDFLADKIIEFYEMNEKEKKRIGENCIECAEDFDWKVLSKKFEEVINYVEEH